MSLHSRSPGRRWIRLGVAIAAAAVASVASHASAKSVPARDLLSRAATAAGPSTKSTVSPAAGRVLGGLTSQKAAVVFEISKNTKRIDQAAINLQLTCTSGDQVWTPDGFSRVPLDAHGSVSMHLTIPPDTSGATNGVTLIGGTDTFIGKLNRKAGTFSGTWRLQLSFSVAPGTTGNPGTTPTTDSCDSGSVTFRARL
jgi:hypothetical protein